MFTGRTDDEVEAPILWPLGKTEGRRRKGQQKIRRLYSITNTKDMILSKLQEILMDREAWCAASMDLQIGYLIQRLNSNNKYRLDNTYISNILSLKIKTIFISFKKLPKLVTDILSSSKYDLYVQFSYIVRCWLTLSLRLLCLSVLRKALISASRSIICYYKPVKYDSIWPNFGSKKQLSVFPT